MKFNFCLGNTTRHDDDWGANHAIALVSEDLFTMLRLGLEACAHSVLVSRTYLIKDGVNLFVNAFNPGNRDMPKKLRAAGYRFGIIQTEWLLNGLFNPFEHKDANARALYQEICEDSGFADFVWYMVEESAEACRASNPNSHFLKIGHVDGFANLTPPERREYEWDFGFAGYSSDHRQAVLSALQAKGARVAASMLEPDYLRRTVLERSRVSLSIQKSEHHPFLSLTRIPHAVMNRLPIVAEYNGPPHYLSPYCATAPARDFVTTCFAYLKSDDLAELAQDAHDRYAAELRMDRILAELIKLTF